MKNIITLKNKKKFKYNNYNLLLTFLNNKLKYYITNIINKNFNISTIYNSVYTLNSFKKNIFFKNIIKYKNNDIYNIKKILIKLFLNKKFNNFNNSLILLNFKLKSKGNINIYNQLINFRGNILNNNNKLIKYPIINTFNKGLNSFEVILSSYGTRKGLLDTSSNTSNAGYLNKKLIEYSNNIIINEFDCLTKIYINYNYNIINYKGFLKKNFLFNFINIYVNLLFNVFFYNFKIKKNYFKFRNILSCINIKNICSKCFNIFSNNYFNINIPIGISITHSLTEPLTQTTLKTFHTGGIENYNIKKTFYFNYNFKYNNKYFLSNFLFKNYYKLNLKNNLLINNNYNKINFNKIKILNGFFIIYKNFNNNYKIKNIKNLLYFNDNSKIINLKLNDNLILNNNFKKLSLTIKFFKYYNVILKNFNYSFKFFIINSNGVIFNKK